MVRQNFIDLLGRDFGELPANMGEVVQLSVQALSRSDFAVIERFDASDSSESQYEAVVRRQGCKDGVV